MLCSPYRLSAGSLWAATIQARFTDYQNDRILKWLPAIVTVYAGKNGDLAIARRLHIMTVQPPIHEDENERYPNERNENTNK
jgi:hypothetical protein